MMLDFSWTAAARREKAFAARALKYGRPANRRELSDILKRIGKATDALRARDGGVLFVRMPSTGAVGQAEETRYPRSKYWDALARNTKALTVHWMDYPELSGFRCVEGSHLKHGDNARFTRELAKERAQPENSLFTGNRLRCERGPPCRPAGARRPHTVSHHRQCLGF